MTEKKLNPFHQFRFDKRINSTQAAKLLGMSLPTYSRLARGEHEAKMCQAHALNKASETQYEIKDFIIKDRDNDDQH